MYFLSEWSSAKERFRETLDVSPLPPTSDDEESPSTAPPLRSPQPTSSSGESHSGKIEECNLEFPLTYDQPLNSL